MLHSSESALPAQNQKEALQGIPVFTHAGFVAWHLITHSFTGSLVLPGVAGRQHTPCELPAPQGAQQDMVSLVLSHHSISVP